MNYDFWIYGANDGCDNPPFSYSTSNPDSSNWIGMRIQNTNIYATPTNGYQGYVKALAVNIGQSYIMKIKVPNADSGFTIDWNFIPNTGTSGPFAIPPVANTISNQTLCINDSDIVNIQKTDAIKAQINSNVSTNDIAFYRSIQDAISYGIDGVAGINEVNLKTVGGYNLIYAKVTDPITGCYSISQFYLTVLQTATIAVSSSAIYIGDPVTITFTGTPFSIGTYAVNGGVGQTFTFPSTGIYTIDQNPLVDTIYKLEKVETKDGNGVTNCTIPINSSKIVYVFQLPPSNNPGGENSANHESTGSFYPIPGGKYLVSGWVKEDYASQQKNYLSSIKISYVDASDTLIGTTSTLTPSGDIIDGWQRIVGIIEIPVGYDNNYISIELLCNTDGADCYFDDIRFLPYNGNMKSFVYDEDTKKLMAELDENNYATFYEYDPEGGLIRVKKETEKGVFTIQETRSSNPKYQN